MPLTLTAEDVGAGLERALNVRAFADCACTNFRRRDGDRTRWSARRVVGPSPAAAAKLMPAC